LRESISVKDFGAVGDGVTDNYNAFKAAIAAINANGGGTLYLPYGNYFINQYIISGGANQNAITDFIFSNCNGLVIEGEGSTIQLKGGWVMTKDYNSGASWYSYARSINLAFDSCTNVTINNLFLNAGAATITKATGLNSENNSNGIVIAGCNQISLNNVNVSYCCTDGLYVDATSNTGTLPRPITTNLFINNSVFTNNARQGCSIIQLRYATIVQSTFANTGLAGSFGAWAPAAGVDIEPNYTPLSGGSLAVSDYTGNINFIDCIFQNNNGFQFVCSSDISTIYPIELSGCSFYSTSASSLVSHLIGLGAKYTNINNCYFNNVGVVTNYGTTYKITANIEYCTFINSLTDYNLCHSIQVGNITGQSVSIKNNNFYFTGTSANTDYGLYIQSPQVTFESNYIFTSASLHNSATYDVIHLVQSMSNARNNTWDTDLTTAGKVFAISFDNTSYVNDYFAAPTYLAPSLSAWPSNYYSVGKAGFNTLVYGGGTNNGATITYGSAAPTTGTYVRGSIVYNNAPSSAGYVGWVCTAAGTPGTWKTFGLIS
jgi:hypothetical protein